MKTSFQLVANMNTAFGNPKGDPTAIDWTRVRKQCANIFDEYAELMVALGVPKGSDELAVLRLAHRDFIRAGFANEPDVEEVRDALCDIPVFALGGQHMIGVDGDADMEAVITGVMTRFVKDKSDLNKTLRMHADKGVLQTYTEGEFPTMIVKSAVDQPDAPRGKFLKSASYQPTVFPPLVKGE